MIDVGDPIPTVWTPNSGSTQRELEPRMLIRHRTGKSRGKLYRVVKVSGGAATITPALGDGKQRESISVHSEVDYRKDEGEPYTTEHYSCDGQHERCRDFNVTWNTVGDIEPVRLPRTAPSPARSSSPDVDRQVSPPLQSESANRAHVDDAENDLAHDQASNQEENEMGVLRPGQKVTSAKAKRAAKAAATATETADESGDAEAAPSARLSRTQKAALKSQQRGADDPAGSEDATVNQVATKRTRKAAPATTKATKSTRTRRASTATPAAAEAEAVEAPPARRKASDVAKPVQKGSSGGKFPFSLVEAAEAAGVSPPRINALRRQGVITEDMYVQQGRAIMYNKAAIATIKANPAGRPGRRPSAAPAAVKDAAPKRRGRPATTASGTRAGASMKRTVAGLSNVATSLQGTAPDSLQDAIDEAVAQAERFSALADALKEVQQAVFGKPKKQR